MKKIWVYSNSMGISFYINKPTFISEFSSLKKVFRGRPSQFLNKLNGLSVLLKKEAVESYHEPFAGVGVSGQMIQNLFPGLKMKLNDFHMEYVKEIEERLGVPCTCEDSMKEDYWREAGRCDCLFFDPPRFTVNHWERFSVSLVLEKTDKVFIWTDVYPYSLKPFRKEAWEAYLKKADFLLQSQKFFLHSWYMYPDNKVGLIKAKRRKPKQIKEIEVCDLFLIRLVEGFGL